MTILYLALIHIPTFGSVDPNLFLRDFENYQEYCSYNSESIFYSNEYMNMSCIHDVDSIQILSETKDSFLEKLETLLGYKPASDIVDNQDPYIKLDFSKAPQLDAIFISTLLYQNDFSGQLISRILKFHASRGTLVHIMGTGYMHSKKAKSLFDELTAFSKNIKIQEYEYHEHNILKKLNLLTNYLRNLHVKLWVTLSSEKPEDNVVIIGGRNVHDGFLFETQPDLSRFPELDQQAPDANYAYWQDIEFKLQSKQFAQTIYAHLLKLWNRNPETLKIEPLALPDTEITQPRNPLAGQHSVRHIISLPFNDDHVLEKFYIEMLDSAKKSVLISSPYLRPTRAVFKSIQRAIARGVQITILTRIDLKGDTQSWLYEETNKAAINELYQNVKIFEWKGDSILHSKLIVIDDELSFIGSVNLSRRSFIQDIESGILVNSKNFNTNLRDVINNYLSFSKPITEKQSRKFWASIIVYLFQNQF